jgi:glucan phosphoethanolaminetransferase (alkaline phosphatase superfamily)
MFVGKLGTFVALGVRGSGMIDNCSFNLGEFYVKMGKTNRNLRREIVMALFLLITYIVILIFQIILFVISIRKKTKKLWRILFSAELVPLLISIGLMIYYNDLPGYGFMPGLTYLGETLFSLGAVVLYCINFLISICSYIAISNKQT